MGKNEYCWSRHPNWLALRLAKMLLINYLRYEGHKRIEIVERRLLSIYDGAMTNYSCISISNILETHFESLPLAKLKICELGTSARLF